MTQSDSTGPRALAGLAAGSTLSSFTAAALYENDAGEPLGARFVHANGMPVDVLFFASVPQVSIYARTLPVSEKGEPHTGEHLLIGKGRIGKYLNSLLQMRLGEHTAGTHTDLTNYQFHTVAGRAGFLELLESYLTALLRPEFTDEEIRREVCNLEVVTGDDGVLALEEKGTVYNEMVSTMEKPESVNWDQLGRLIYGADHPLARNQGGLPAAIRELTIEDVRGFHTANYHLGPNMAMVAALPLAWSHAEFLAALDVLFVRLASREAPAEYPRVPPHRPAPPGAVAIASYPADDAGSPQRAMFAWPAPPEPTLERTARAALLLDVLAGGETSYLHRDLVDRATRTFETGATGVGAYLDGPPLGFPVIVVDGLAVGQIEVAALGRLRDAVRGRITWLAGLAPGSAELAEAAAKARSLISAGRRATRKFMDDPPHFGDRGSGIAWHRHLDRLCAEGGFTRSVSQSAVYDRFEAELAGGANPWTAIVRESGLDAEPYVAAVRPDPSLLGIQRAEKDARMAAAGREMVERTGAADLPAALAQYAAQVEAATAELEARDREIPSAPFVADPPLALDDVDYRWDPARGRGEVLTHFGSSPFTDVRLAFDLSGLPDADLELVPLLDTALSEVGMTTADGTALDYVAACERQREEIYYMGAGVAGSAVSGRRELTLTAAAASPADLPRAVEWLESALLRRARGAPIRARLIDVAIRSIKYYRNIFQQSEESWVQTAAAAWVYQDQPLYMAVASPFTCLRHFTRLRWRLEDPDPEAIAAHEKLFALVEAGARAGNREELAAALAAGSGELAELFCFELGHLPPDSFAADLARLVRETRADLVAGSAGTLARLESVFERVLTRAGARLHVMGSLENAARASELTRALLDRLPAGEAASPPRAIRRAEPLVVANLARRSPGAAGRPVHVALVNEGTKAGVHVASAPGPSYHDASDDALRDYLAGGLFAGAGPHAFFMQTWSAGLAYSNGFGVRPQSGRLQYYAERCPDLVQTMSFVAELGRTPLPADPFLVAYSLASAFDDYRGASDFSSRGEALAANLADGLTPEVVRAFKSRLIAAAAEPDALEAMLTRARALLARVLVGAGGKVSATPGASAFVIGPEPLLARWEQHLKAAGEAERLVRLYPADFWPPEAA